MKKTIIGCLVGAAAVIATGQLYFPDVESGSARPAKVSKSQLARERLLSEEGGDGEKQDGYSRFADFHRQLRTPDGQEVPGYEVNYQIRELLKSRDRSSQLRTLGTVLDWKSRGPGNIPGRTRALVVMPNDPTESTWLAGSVGGGVWRTTNNGASWTNITPDLPNLAISALAVAASNPQVIYAGTGEGFGNLDAIAGAGIFKSVDGGATWAQLPATVADNSFRVVNRIVVDPANPNVVVACANTSTGIFNTATSGIFRSQDGGATWTKVYSSQQPVQQVIAAPGNFSLQYAAVRQVGVLKSVDGGVTWAATAADIKSSGRIELAVSPSSPLTVAASVEGSLSGEAGADLYISYNGGVSWAYVSEKNDNNFDFLEQGDYDNAIMFHPFNNNIVYVAGVNIFKFTIDNTAPSEIKTIQSFTKNGATFVDFVSFNGNDLPGLQVGDIPNDQLVNVEIRFGPGLTQKAARFTVNKQGSGVPANQYQYRDYVEVPMQAWDVTNNRQLMLSFRDQQEDGKFSLIASNTDGPGESHSREYLFVHLIPYTETPSTAIAVAGGHEHQMLFNIWPVLAAGSTWAPTDLPASNLAVAFSTTTRYKKTVNVVADGYGEHTQFSGGSVVNPTSTIHVDHHVLLPSRVNQANSTFRIISANDGGVYHSAEATDPGVTNGAWTFAGSGMVTGQFYGVDKRPGADQYIGGLQDNSTNISQEGVSPGPGASYTRVIGGDGFDAVWHYADARYVIGSAQFNSFYRSDNFGQTWQLAVSGLPSANFEDKFPFFSRLGNSKSMPEMLFCVGTDGVYRSLNFGERWTLSSMAADWSYRGSFTNIEVSKSNPMIVWAGGAMSGSQTLQVSTDRGATFRKVSNYTATAALKGVVTGIESHPFEDSTAFALFSYAGLPKILRTKDLGTTWQDISGFEGNTKGGSGLPDVAVYSLLVLPNDPAVIWAGTEIGLYESMNDGQSWSQVSGFPAAAVWDMKVVDDQVVVATHGRGIYTAQLAGVAPVVVVPAIESLGVKPSGLVTATLDLRSAYDSTQIVVNGSVAKKLGATMPAKIPTQLFVEGQSEIEVLLRSYVKGKMYSSTSKSVSVELRLPTREYANNFDEPTGGVHFSGNGFSVTKPIGFQSMALHTPHNYHDDTTYIYKLLTPIIINAEKPTFKYRDIALVEAGESGTVYGDIDFFDYVVVEGTKDGINWLPIAPGYDVRYNTSWQTVVDSGGKGSEALYVNHSVNLLNTFSNGDTVIFRFRLYADQLANEWGWAIDDLKIQTESTSTLTAALAPEEWKIYPNPASEVLYVEVSQPLPHTTRIEMFDMGGKIVHTSWLEARQTKTQADMMSLKPGVYVLRATAPGFSKNFRVIKR